MLSSATSSPASSVYSPSPSPSNGSWVQELSHDQQSVRLIGLLYQCAAEVSAGSFDRANLCLEHITQLASLDAPHALQRLAAVFADALARKLLNLIPGLSRALLSSANSADAHLVPVARRHMFDVLPFLKLAYLTTNHAILEAMEGERFVHVVDFSGPAANPVQWIALFHAFRGRREGPPHLRITAVHDSKEFLANMAAVLSKEAEAFDIAFQFNAVEAKLDEMDFDALRHDLGVRSGEALAVSVVLQLHRLLAVDDGRSHAATGCLTPDDMLSSATSSPASSVYSPSPSPSNGSWVQELSHDQQSVRLIGLLYQCAAEVSAGSFDRANLCLEHITQLASLDAPHALQRLAAVFADALARKLLNLIPGLSRALLSSANSADAHLVPVARRHMFDVLPFLKLAYLTTNHAILEAMEGERFVHVVDFSGPAANPVQWIALFHAFRGRREGPPHLRITAVHDSKEFLANMAAVLSKEAEAFDIAFQFNAVEAKLDEMDFDALRHDLGVRSGEALAVSVVLQLHRLLAVDDGRRHAAAGCLTPLGSFLSAVRSLSPKIMVMTEQEANHNGGAFQERFDEALNYYASLFDCLQRSAAAAAERARVERVLLGEEIRGVVACEGAERTERHERARQWAARMEAAGMESVGLSYSGAMEARKLLQSCGWAGPYEVRHDAGGHGFFFCWHKRPLYAVTAWRPVASRRGHTRS
ncbi:hypothetical protein OsI_35061 [Oryza sativa Indica Group]|uniref:Scarecrow-like protein 3 n=1 Tax=Oryza sativa subsp. indica TaxID=39946 RepID=B8BJ16_ORYSI|nr:hypothetical protein OsI_35061 [Oryza sativa Indica Group]